jgi:hypothetical protein
VIAFSYTARPPELDVPSFDLLLRIGFPIVAIVVIGIVAAARYADAGPLAWLLHKADPVVDPLIEDAVEGSGHLLEFGPPREASVRKFALTGVLFLIALYLCLHYFVLRDEARIPAAWLWPTLATFFGACAGIVLVGTRRYFGRLGVTKWSFWVALLSSLSLLLPFCYYWPARMQFMISLNGLLLAVLFFGWVFKKLQLLDGPSGAPRSRSHSKY